MLSKNSKIDGLIARITFTEAVSNDWPRTPRSWSVAVQYRDSDQRGLKRR